MKLSTNTNLSTGSGWRTPIAYAEPVHILERHLPVPGQPVTAPTHSYK